MIESGIGKLRDLNWHTLYEKKDCMAKFTNTPLIS